MTDFSELVDALRVMEAKETAAKLFITEADRERSRQAYYDALSGRHEGTLYLVADPLIAAAEALRVKQLYAARRAQSGKI